MDKDSHKQKTPAWAWVLIIIVVIGGWFLYNNYTSEQRHDRERAYCVSVITTNGYFKNPTGYCYQLPNSTLDSVYKVGQ